MPDDAASRPAPYVGPRAFTTGERLYGRDRELTKLLHLLIAERIVLLYSPSGAGKTSLIQAGLVPRLREEEFAVLPVVRISLDPPAPPDGAATGRPLNRYLLSVMLSLEEAVPPEERLPLEELSGLDLDAYLRQRAQSVNGRATERVLLFDQFEEILTSDPTDEETKRAFFAQLGEALRDRSIWALFALREDYVAGLDPYLRPIPTRLQTTFRLDLLGVEAARDAMQRPAESAGVEFAEPAAERLADDLRRVRVQQPDGAMTEQLGPHIEPVQLQVVCLRLWQHLPAGATVIEEGDLQAAGDVDEALASYYAERVAGIAADTGVSERAIREWVDEQLITPQGIRGQVLQGVGRSEGLDNRAIEALVDAHLVRAEKRRGFTWFELAHDRLVAPVHADNLGWRERHLSPLQRQAALWDQQDRPDGLLLHDSELADAERWAAEQPESLTDPERQFLAISRRRQASADRERRRNRLVRRLAVGASVVSVVAIVMLIVAVFATLRAREQSRLAFARELLSSAISDMAVDPQRSIALVLHAIDASDQIDEGQTESVLQQALQGSRVRLTLDHGGEVWSVQFSPDGKLLATGMANGTVTILDADSGQQLLSHRPHDGEVGSIAFSPSGTLATAGWDGAVRLWESPLSDQPSSLLPHQGAVTSIAFNGDGTRLATASADGRVRTWDTKTRQSLPPILGGQDGLVQRIALSPGGDRVVTASQADTTVRVWNVATRREAGPALVHPDAVTSIALSPDGTRLATGAMDFKVRIWDVGTAQEISTLVGLGNTIFATSFSPDGTLLATGTADGDVRVWSVREGRELIALPGHTGSVQAVAFSPDGMQLATASTDGTVRVWDLSFRHADGINAVVFDRSGTRLATASGDGAATIWDVAARRPVRRMGNEGSEPDSGPVLGVAFSPDGTRLATAGVRGIVKVRDATTGADLVSLTGLTATVLAVVFDREGNRLATVDEDGGAYIWDAGSGQMLFALPAGESGDVRFRAIAYAADGGRLATGDADGVAKLWDAATGQEQARFAGRSQPILSVTLSGDGRRLATAGMDNAVTVWDVATQSELFTVRGFPGHTFWVTSVAFSPDGSRLISGGADKRVNVWDPATGDLVRAYNNPSVVDAIAFSPDGRSLAVVGTDGGIYLYPLSMEDLKAAARARLTRHLTDEECRRYLHREECPPLPGP